MRFKKGDEVEVKKAPTGYTFTGIVSWQKGDTVCVNINKENGYSMVQLGRDEIVRLNEDEGPSWNALDNIMGSDETD